ncbi:MAG: hypothetical protein JW827_06030 [Spirochaetes bacterium]|nr:hypothetical protein [Spirochaetota bacterium]
MKKILFLLSLFLFLIIQGVDLNAKGYLFYFPSHTSFLVIFSIVVFIMLVIGITIMIYFNNVKKENLIQILLNIERIWNSTSMLESRQKCLEYISDNHLYSNDDPIRNSLRHSKAIMDFFDHLGRQVYNEIMDFQSIYRILGHEIIDFWDRRNYKLLAAHDKQKEYSSDTTPWEGFEYLAHMCQKQKEWEREKIWMPVKISTMGSLREKKAGNNSLNILIIVFSTIFFTSCFIFLLFYSGLL